MGGVEQGPIFPWDHFRYIKAIADAGSLSGAARLLTVNESTVFRRLRDIERELGARLFMGKRGSYVLTPLGEEMVRLATRMADDIAAFERRTKGQ
jgi:DNA-binding transcriptional LysR family regulator